MTASETYLKVLRLPSSELLDVTALAEKALSERVAPLVRLVGELHVAALAHVAVHVEVLLHRNHAHRLLRSLKEQERRFWVSKTLDNE